MSVLLKHDLLKNVVFDWFVWWTEDDEFLDDGLDAMLEKIEVIRFDKGTVGQFGVFEFEEKFEYKVKMLVNKVSGK